MLLRAAVYMSAYHAITRCSARDWSSCGVSKILLRWFSFTMNANRHQLDWIRFYHCFIIVWWCNLMVFYQRWSWHQVPHSSLQVCWKGLVSIWCGKFFRHICFWCETWPTPSDSLHLQHRQVGERWSNVAKIILISLLVSTTYTNSSELFTLFIFTFTFTSTLTFTFTFTSACSGGVPAEFEIDNIESSNIYNLVLSDETVEANQMVSLCTKRSNSIPFRNSWVEIREWNGRSWN